MKNCNEMVNSLFERREKYIAEQKKNRKVITHTVTSVCCICLIVLFGFGIWKTEIFKNLSPIKTDDKSTDSIGENVSTNQNDNSFNSFNGGIVEPNNCDSDLTEKNVIISSFNTDDSAACYAAPKNGDYFFSLPLQRAMEEYGDTVKYRVVVSVFCEKEEQLANSTQVQAEIDRLSDIGYTVAQERYFDGEKYTYYFTLHATYDELNQFAVNDSYGYFMFLYDEYTGSTEDMANVYNNALQ